MDINDSFRVTLLTFKRKTESTTTNHQALWEEDLCDICMKMTTRRCTICKKGFFCSDPCQEKRSGHHLLKCSKRPLTSADYLWKSCEEDLLPKEEDVLADFGFNNILVGHNQTYLFGTYQGLFRTGKVSAEDMHEWRTGGVMVGKIKEFYLAIPESARGGYFP